MRLIGWTLAVLIAVSYALLVATDLDVAADCAFYFTVATVAVWQALRLLEDA